jgi:hypothetical protein
VDIWNAEALTEIFGGWPSFHDAEILGLRVDSGQRSNGVVTLQLDVHLFAADGVLPDGRMNWVKHTLATLEFERVESLRLDGFGPQNVLFDLEMKDVQTASDKAIQVTLPASNGLEGSFRCGSVVVIRTKEHFPGPHSIYGNPESE